MNRLLKSMLLANAVAATQVIGQVSVGPLCCVSCGNALNNAEVALIASPINSSKVAVAWNTFGSSQLIWYAVSNDGGTTFHSGAPLPVPCALSGEYSDDPVVAGRFDGPKWDLWLGGRQGGTLFMDALPAASVTVAQADSVSVSSCAPHYDKPFAAVGPCALCYTGSPAMYVTSAGNNSCYHSTGEPLGTQFATGQVNLGVVEGHFPVVLRDQPHVGRVVVAGLTTNVAGLGQVTAVYSDDEGGVWHHVATGPSPGDVTLDTDSNLAAILPLPEDQGGGTSVTDDGFCSVATDPRDTNTLVVAFPGVPEVAGTPIDVYVAVSTDGGASFLVNNNQRRVYRIPDSMWRLPGEPNQFSQEFMPSITIDSQGGVDLMVVRLASDGATASIRFARWGSLDSLTSGASPSTLWRLSSDYQVSGIGIGGQTHNDYQMITASGCYIWCGYAIPAPQGSGDTTDAWVQRIDLLAGSCTVAANVADFNRDSAVTTDDVVAFTAAYSAGASTADVDGNQAVNAADAVAYLNAYNQASHP
jgi:hypothetical protein